MTENPTHTSNRSAETAPQAATPAPGANPLLAPSPLPYQLPDFAAIREEHFRPAFEQGMAEHLAEIDAIAADPAPPTVANTVVALERSGALLTRAALVFENLTASCTTPALQELEAELSPRLAAHSDAVHLDPRLFARIDAVHSRRDELDLDQEDARLLDHHHTAFVRAGARLAPAEQQRLREINAELADLSAAFDRNLLAANRAAAIVVDSADALAGLSADGIAAAAVNAEALGHPASSYVISLKNFSNQTELAQLADPALRRRLLDASLGRAADTNGPLALRMARLRAERAALLGHPTHAAWQVADQTAGTPAAVEEMMGSLVAPAMRNADAEAAALTEAAGLRPEDGPLHPADWQFYAEAVRKERFDLDTAALRPYLELDAVLRDGVFHAAGLVYGLTFTDRPDLRAYHPDVRVFEVFDAEGTALGLFLFDPFARDGKRGGAWMHEYVQQSQLLGQRPVVVNNLNIAKPPAGEPALLTWDEVTTAFHEFGHALHGLLSDVRYPSLAGTEVPRDFVEYPSQVNEMWSEHPEVLTRYARHHRTGEPLPAGELEKLREAARFGEGFKVVEQLAATLLDWSWHTVTADQELPETAEEFERAALARWGLAHPSVPPRYRSAYFAHIFAGGYAAGYYGYLWSEVLDADTVDWFEHNGRTPRESGDLFRAELLSRGGTVVPLDAYAAFRGRAPRPEPLLTRRGLID